jgi:NAD(P)-dependent dehydrogenase (short-subunit alcohol dehydrogenase family)
MNPTYDFTGQVALVTGGSSGMGLATARAFAEAGAAVVIADINETTLGTAADELTAAGHRVLGVRCDVSDEHSVAAMVKATVHTFGRLDMAYNNAGIQVPPSDAADEPAEVFDRVNAINLRGVWACMKHELGQMRAQGSGAIRQLLLPRRSGWTSGPGGLPCVQARGDRADHQRRLEYAPRGIRINAVCPGAIDTPMVADMAAKGDAAASTPIARLGHAEEIAASVLWLCRPRRQLRRRRRPPRRRRLHRPMTSGNDEKGPRGGHLAVGTRASDRFGVKHAKCQADVLG